MTSRSKASAVSRLQRRARGTVRRLDRAAMESNRRAWRALRHASRGRESRAAEIGRLARQVERLSTGSKALALRIGFWAWHETSIGRTKLVLKAARQALDEGDFELAGELVSVGRLLPRGAGPYHELRATLSALRGEWRRARNDYRSSLPRDRTDRSQAAALWVVHQQALNDIRSVGPGRGLPPVPNSQRVEDARESLGSAVARVLASHETLEGWDLLFEAYARLHWEGGSLAAPEEVASTVRTMSLASFRNHIAGKSIALIANSPTLIGGGLGSRIDSYDLVMRFNSFVVDAEHTGAKTDIHVTIHMHDYNWQVPVDVRIVLSGRQHLWDASVKQRVRAGAQNWVGDASLRWPAPTLKLIESEYRKGLPTAGFNMMTLLDYLDVNPVIDLIGFDFYESGLLRVAGAEQVPLSPAHDPATEKAWVLQRAVNIDGQVISLR